MGVLAAVGALAGAGTFASFTAQTKNPGNTFADGTLVMSNQVDSAAACLSTNATVTDSNVDQECDTIFDLSVQKPGDSDTTNVTIQNKGSLAASALNVFSAACTDADTAEAYHGTGSPCGKVQFYIQQYSDATRLVPSACVYGNVTVALTCDFAGTTNTLANFVADHTTAEAGWSAGSLAAAGGADTAWFTIGVMLPTDSTNNYQGRSAALDINWHIVQVT